MAQSKDKVVVILPTYNEAGNIEDILTRLIVSLRGSGYNFHIIVVDDNSPDGTAKAVLRIRRQHQDKITLIPNKDRRGIGYAYKLGYDYALNRMGADILIEMDADGQHLPEQVPELLCQIDAGYDFVIGSRRMNGGENSISRRGLWRYFLTVFGGFLVRFFLFWPGEYFRKFSDPTSGFRAIRREIARKIDFANLISYGFAYKYDTIYRISKEKAQVCEIPLRFQDRQYGASKMERGAVKEALMSAIRIRLNR